MQVCLMALGHCSHEHYPVLFEELPGLVEEYQRTKQRRGTAARPEEVSKPTQRTAAAHVVLSIPACLAAVCRLLARVPPGPSKAGWCDRSFESARPYVAWLLQTRKSVANVMRLLADTMPPGTLTTQLVMRARFLEWIRDTAMFLRQLPRFGEAFWEVSQVCSCCSRLASTDCFDRLGHPSHALGPASSSTPWCAAVPVAAVAGCLLSVCCLQVRGA
jgi:hypothetical protein